MRRDCLARRDDEGTAGLSVPIQQRRNPDGNRMALADMQKSGLAKNRPAWTSSATLAEGVRWMKVSPRMRFSTLAWSMANPMISLPPSA